MHAKQTEESQRHHQEAAAESGGAEQKSRGTLARFCSTILGAGQLASVSVPNLPEVEDSIQNLTWRKALNLDDAATATLIARKVAKRKDNGTMTVPPGGETRLQIWLRIDQAKKPRICAQIYETAGIFNLNYWLEIVFSAAIAVFGLVINSPAVIIGAMLISPLMGPIMAMGLALAAGDLYLAIKATANLLASVSLAVGLSAFIVWLLPFHSITTEILARTNPTLLDLGIALFSGLAGSVAVSRMGGGEAVTTLPSVAIAASPLSL
jgi:uncharacterized hydrophobic protein (TIGR00271 family)